MPSAPRNLLTMLNMDGGLYLFLPVGFIIINIIALQHSEDMDKVNDEQKLVLNGDEN